MKLSRNIINFVAITTLIFFAIGAVPAISSAEDILEKPLGGQTPTWGSDLQAITPSVGFLEEKVEVGNNSSKSLVAEGVMLINRFAPGEFLPISAKLLNFGAGRRVDVSITYKILDIAGAEIISSSETVAVETTASFVKLIQLPRTIAPGIYMASTSILYAGQEFPATSSFEFLVEQKFAGFFLSQWIFYGFAVILFSGTVLFITRYILKNKKKDRLQLHDYSQIQKDDRIFYEILSDIITQMRLRVGDKALELAGGIEGFVINEDGRILSISKNPAKIIALLVLRYERELGEKISFGLRQIDGENKEKMEPVDKNLVIVRKYFE